MLDGRQVFNQASAVLRHQQSGLVVLIQHGLQHFFQCHPALDAVVAGPQQAQAVFREQLRHALAAVLLPVPHIRRRDGAFDMLSRRRQIQRQPCRLADDQAALLYLPVHIGPPVVVHRNPETGEHIQAVVKDTVLLPLGRDAVKGLDHVGLPPELREEGAGQSVPVAVPPCLPHVLR